MQNAQTIVFAMTFIAALFCPVFISSGQIADKEDPIEDVQHSTEEIPSNKAGSDLKKKLHTSKDIFTRIKDKITSYIPSDGDSKNERAFDFSTNGDDIIQNFNFFAKVPFKLRSYEVSISGKYHQTYQKKGPSSEMQHPSEWEPLPHWMLLSKSYAFGFEGSSTRKILRFFTLGGQIDYERDFSIIVDPHVHVDIFTRFPLVPRWDWLKGAVGIWLAGQQLIDTPTFRSGFHFHIDINSKYFNMMIEALPQWDFRELRVIASPEAVIKFKPFGKELAFVLHGEIEYYHKKTGLTVEPVFDINPWDIRWTQLFRVPF